MAFNARRAVLATLLLMLTGWVCLFALSNSLRRGPSPDHLGGDYALLISGARVLEDGRNPYDQHVLYRAERQVMIAAGIVPPKYDPFMRVGTPPLMLWAMRPLAHYSFADSAVPWCLAMYVMLAASCVSVLAALGWRRRVLPLLAFLAFPQTIYAAYYGNVDGLVALSLGGAALLARRRPFAAGCILTLALLKPQVALPGALLIILFLSSSRRRSIEGFALGCAVALLATLLLCGADSVGWWLSALTGYSERLEVQPDIAALSGLYVYSASDTVRVVLEGASLAGILAVTLAWWRRLDAANPVEPITLAWLWIAWFLATPFAHFHDEVVLLLPILGMLGRDARWAGELPAAIALATLLLSILIFPTARAHTDYQSLTLVVVVVCAIVLQWRHGDEDLSRHRDRTSSRQRSRPAVG